MKKHIWKRCAIWVTLITLLVEFVFISTGSLQQATAEGSSVFAQLKEAAQIQLVTNTFRKCAEMMSENDGGYTHNSSNIKTNGIFGNEKTEITTGAWLENQVQGKVNNGTIYCKDNNGKILNLFASSIGAKWEDVICDGSKPGIMEKLVLQTNEYGNDVWESAKNSCADGLGGGENYLYRWEDKETALNYIAKLYNKKREANPYLPDFSSINDFTGKNNAYKSAINYYLYVSELEAACEKGPKYEKNKDYSTSNYFSEKLYVPRIDGSSLKYDEYFYKKSPNKDWDNGWLGEDQAHTCETVLKRITKKGDNYDNFKKALQAITNDIIKGQQEELRIKCNGQATQTMGVLQDMINNSQDENEKAALQQRWAEISAMRGSGDELKKDGNDGRYAWKTLEDGTIVCRLNPDRPLEIDGEGTLSFTPAINDTDIGGGLTDLPNNESSGTDVNPCSDATGSLGWILCSVIEIVGDGAQGLYASIEDDLEVQPTILNQDSAVYDGWATFRNYANVAFAIALVVVILAQLTGIGISNYNIKKILPRLIVVVVLVNISYILCQLAVDLSNVVGYGLKDFFHNLAVKIAAVKLDGQPFTISGGIGALFVALFGAGAAFAGAATVVLAGAELVTWIIPILVGLLGIIISVFFFFLLLGIRKAGAIILVVLAPLAIVCYSLPNTKSIFDRWKKLFISVLLVFPICGALMGGGEFASTILVQAGITINPNTGAREVSFFYVLIAMLLNVVPFFFVPSILKNSMSAIGNLGAKIAAFGQKARGGITNGINKSDFVQNRQRNLANWANAKRADHYQNKLDKGKKLRGWQQRRNANATQANRKFETERAMAAATRGGAISKEDYDNMVAKFQGKNRDEATENQEAAYKTGVMNYDGTDKINANDFSIGGSLYQEGESLLRALDSGTLGGAEKEKAQTRLRAVANMLSTTGDGRRALTRLMQNDLTTNSHTNGAESGLGYLGSHLVNSGIAGKYKKSNRDMFAFSNNLADRKYVFNSSGDAIDGDSGVMSSGDYTRRYRLYGSASMSSADFTDMDENDLADIYSALGSADASTVKNFRNLANGVMSNPNVFDKLQPKVQEQVRKIATYGYGEGAQGAGVSSLGNATHTVGSRALAKEAGTGTLTSLSNHIAELASDGKLTVGGQNFDSKAYQQVQDLTENARRALLSGDALEAGVADGLQEVINSARNAGVVDSSGDAFGTVDPAFINIKGVRQSTTADQAVAMEASYQSGNVQSVAGGQLDTSNISALQAEQQALLGQLAADPTNQEVQVKLGAVQNMMAAQGPAGIEAISNTFANQLGGGARLSANQQSALQYAAQQISSGQYGSQVATADPVLSKMIDDISGGTFNIRSSANQVKNDYANAAMQVITPEKMVNMSNDARANFITNISGAPQPTVTATARAASNAIGQYGANLNQQQLRELHTLLANSLGAGSPVPGATSPTTGAKAFIEAGPAAIQSTINWLRTTPFTTPAEQAMARNVVENARIAANYYDGKASKSAIDGLLDIQVAANDAGIRDRNGNNF